MQAVVHPHRLIRGSLAATIALAAAPAAAQTIEPTFPAVRAAISQYEAAHPGATLPLEDVLARLPEDYRASYVLMRHSQSSQSSTDAAPRAILFGDDAQTIITFNGDPAASGYKRLEFAALDPATHALEFRSITWPDGGASAGTTVVSPPNPPQCLSCHGPTPHYVWRSYPSWPDAFGSEDDALELTPGEREAYTAFRAVAPDHPRYRNLVVEFPELSPVAPYRPTLPGEQPTGRGAFDLAFEFRPNARFGMLLLRHLAQTRIATAARSPAFASGQAAFAFLLANCGGKVDDALARRVLGALGTDSYRTYAERFGLPATESWHFERGPLETGAIDFYPGLSTLQPALLSELWARAFAGDAALAPFYRPLDLPAYVKTSRYHYFATERGLAFWAALDANGPILSGLPGTTEAEMLASSEGYQGLKAAEARQLCRLLGDRALARP